MSARPDMTPGEIAQAGRNAPHGFGPWASEWTDKPHRIVYDLASALEAASAELSALKAEHAREEMLRVTADALAATEPIWPDPIHDGCNYTAYRAPDDSGLFCNKCGWSWSATAARLNIALTELSALKATSPDGPTKDQAWAGYRAAQGAVIDAGFTGDVSPRDAIEALSARLAALEARRCDGCAHSNTEHYSKEGTWLVCLLADNEEGGSPAYVAVEDYPLVVSPSHSCAAWTEEP